MPRFLLLVEYAGTRYSGWQIQKNARTVQGEIVAPCAKPRRSHDFELYGSGRTDAGVHALAQVAHLEPTQTRRPAPRRKINDTLPADIHIRRINKARTGSTRGTTVARSYLSDFRAAHRLRASPTCGGCASRSTSAHADAATRSPDAGLPRVFGR